MINTIIGAGIFGLPSKVFQLSGTYSILAFVVCALVIFNIIICFAEVGSRFDKTGGPYIYILEAFGSFPAFIMGWLLLWSRIISYAALINLLVTYSSYYHPALNHFVPRLLIMVILTALLTGINYVGVKKTTTVNNFLTIGKMVPLVIFILVGLFFLQPELLSFQEMPEFNNFSSSVLLLVFAFGGFEVVVINSGEMKNPNKIVPYALIISALIVMVLYGSIQLVSVGTLPGLGNSEKPLADAAQSFMGDFGGNLITIGAIVSIVGALNAILLVGSRLLFALSDEEQLPQTLSTIHEKYRTPTVALFVFTVISLIIAVTGSFIYAITITAIIRTVMYAMVCGALIKLRKQDKKGKEAAYIIPHGKLFALTGILFSIWLFSSSQLVEMRDVLICILVGVVTYWIYKKSKGI
ncbi:MAG TPA: amino acid transporter [Cytophagales bacterium]|nr:amino acid transporter [Cytophagales bacterium]HCR52827.1 amino acid transporter [Cytophagales bacterium]